MQTTIYLARHGKTAANLENRFAGRSSEPLHPEGQQQFAVLAGQLEGLGTSGLYAGPLPRTRESAEIVSRRTGAPVTVVEAFNEIDIPHWDNLTKTEITERFGDEYPTWLAAPDRFSVPGCETISQVQARAVPAVESLFSRHPGSSVAVISHLIVIRCLVLHYRQLPISEFRSIRIDNASLTGLVRRADGTTSVVPDIGRNE